MKIVKHFDALVSVYDSYASLAKISEISDVLSTKIGACTGKKVLDIATGTGNFGQLFVEKGSNVTGLDVNKKMLNEASKKGIQTVLGSATELPFQNRSFDIVLSRQLFQYLSLREIKQTLEEISRVLVNNGKIILHHITAPTTSTLDSLRLFMAVNGTPTLFLSCDELAELVNEAGLIIEHKEVHGFRVEESVDNFCKVRNLKYGELAERINTIKNIEEYNLKHTDMISYIRHYSLIIATKNNAEAA